MKHFIILNLKHSNFIIGILHFKKNSKNLFKTFQKFNKYIFLFKKNNRKNKTKSKLILKNINLSNMNLDYYKKSEVQFFHLKNFEEKDK